MRLTDGQQEQLLAWAGKRLSAADGEWPDGSLAFGVVEPRDGQKPLLRAVLVVNEMFKHGCKVHIASDGSRRWATRDVLMRFSALVHLGMGINRMSIVIAATNVAAQIAALKIGFQVEGRERGGADDGSDGVMFSMLKDENPWLKGEPDGQEST